MCFGMNSHQCFTGSAQGKLIVFGEYAVILGFPALAIPSDQSCTCQIKRAEGDGIYWQGVFYSWEEIDALYQSVNWRHARFLAGELAAQDILQSTADYVFYCVALYMNHADCRRQYILHNGWEIVIDSTIPMGSGMGSSAALAAAIMRCCINAWGEISNPLTQVECAENIAHGRSSGLDAWVCWHNRPVLWQNGQISSSDIPALFPFTLSMSGMPQSTTAQCVAQAMPQLKKNQSAWQNVLKDLVAALQQQDYALWLANIRAVHRLLCAIGVVPVAVQERIAAIEAVGGAAKISGAGSVSGNAAGALLAWRAR